MDEQGSSWETVALSVHSPLQEGFALLRKQVFLVARLLNAPSCPIYTEGTTKDSPVESQPTLFLTVLLLCLAPVSIDRR